MHLLHSDAHAARALHTEELQRFDLVVNIGLDAVLAAHAIDFIDEPVGVHRVYTICFIKILTCSHGKVDQFLVLLYL